MKERDKERFRLQQGDILFSHINSAIHVGKTAVFDSDEEVYHGVNLLLMRPSSEVTSSYLEHSLKFLFQSGYWRGVCKQSVNQASVNQQDISRVRVSFPTSREEQQRIVGLLDEAFGGLATAQAHAAQNLQNARDLFESHLNAVFTREIATNHTRSLLEFCERITKGSSPKWQGMEYVKKPGILFVTSENVHQNQLIVDEPKYVEQRFNDKEKRSILRRGDVLTNLVGASIGRTAVYDLDDVANINQAVGLIRCHADKLYNYYLMYFFNSPSMRTHFHSNEINNARANISLTFVSEVQVPVTTIERQKEVVGSIRDFHRETKRLESIYRSKLAAIDELKKSLLHQAFSGEL